MFPLSLLQLAFFFKSLLKTFLISPLKLEVNYSLENDLIPEWIQHKNIFGLTIDKPVFDIGTRERYHKFLEIVD